MFNSEPVDARLEDVDPRLQDLDAPSSSRWCPRDASRTASGTSTEASEETKTNAPNGSGVSSGDRCRLQWVFPAARSIIGWMATTWTGW